jgi:uncharacterized membrane protein (UPF0127 family)
VTRWRWIVPLLLAWGPASGVAEEVDVRILPAAGGAAITIHAEVARDPEVRRRGLMWRRELAVDAGMLFLMEAERVQRFWMKNCFIPLDMVFADGDGRVVHVVHQALPCPPMRADCPTYSSDKPASVVLELAGGVAARHGIGAGSRLLWPR